MCKFFSLLTSIQIVPMSDPSLALAANDPTSPTGYLTLQVRADSPNMIGNQYWWQSH